MTRIVLIEAHPLMLLGLHQILTRNSNDWEIEALDAGDIQTLDISAERVDIAIFGLPAKHEIAVRLLETMQRALQPQRILLLSDDCSCVDFRSMMDLGNIYGCIKKTAPFEVLDAALRIGIAGGECFPRTDEVEAAKLATESLGWSVRHDGGASSRNLPATALVNLSSTYPTRVQVDSHTFDTYADRDDVELRKHSESTGVGQKCKPMPGLSLDDTERVLKGAQLLDITPRQYEVLVLLARGHPLKTVSRLLNISTATAKAHASTLYQRLHVSSKGEAVFAARQRGALLD